MADALTLGSARKSRTLTARRPESSWLNSSEPAERSARLCPTHCRIMVVG